MKIFFSWSGQLSKKIAKILKPWIEEDIFPSENIDVFISDEDIQYGAEWYQDVKRNLIECDLAIIFLTPENMNAPWLNFEAGAIAIGENNSPVIAFLIDVPSQNIKSPLKQYQCLDINNETINKLVCDIKQIGNFKTPSLEHIDVILEKSYASLKSSILEAKEQLSKGYVHEPIVVFPKHISAVKKDKIFIGSPMASVKETTYESIRKDALRLKSALIKYCDFDDVYYPGENITGQNYFDGQEKAILNDFKLLKESEHYIFIYPKKVTSSILMEMGYAIALSKNTLIFTNGRKSLPYMLQQADKAIPNIRIYEYRSFDEVISLIQGNGITLFSRKSDL